MVILEVWVIFGRFRGFGRIWSFHRFRGYLDNLKWFLSIFGDFGGYFGHFRDFMGILLILEILRYFGHFSGF